MTERGIVGLLALNAAYLGTGLAVLWALRGFRSWADPLRLAGLAYLVGVAAFGTLWTQLLVLGVPFGGFAIVVSLVAIAAAGLVVGRLRGVAVPRGWPSVAPRETLLVTAAGVGLTGLLLEAYFRAGRLQGLQSYDGWAFWVPKGKAIYFFDGLDEQVFTTTANPFYPPLVPILDAASFHAIGSADPVTLHLQYWLFVVGAVAAIAGCLHRHTTPWLLWPPLVLALALPRFGTRLLEPQADMLVDVLFVAAAVLIVLWLRDRRGWRLAAAAILLSGATLTKREGLFFAACALGLALVVAWRRGAWRPVLVVAAVVGAAALPWRLWYRSHGIGGEGPAAAGVDEWADRALDALELSIKVLFDASLWSILPVLVVIAVGVALWAGDRLVAGFTGTLLILLFLGGAWVTVSYTELPITDVEALNPIVRYTGVIVLLGASLVPLLLQSAWRGGSEVES